MDTAVVERLESRRLWSSGAAEVPHAAIVVLGGLTEGRGPWRYDMALTQTRVRGVWGVLSWLPICLLAVATGCATTGYRPSSEHHRMLGGRLHREGNYAGAIAEYDRALALDAGNAHAYNDRGCARRSMGDFAGALSYFDAGISARPSYGTLYFNRAHTNAYFIAAGSTPADLARVDVSAVLADYEAALRRDRSNLDAYKGRFLIFLARGDFARAGAEIDRRLRAAPRDPQAPLWRGVRLLLRYRDADADREFERFFSRFPDTRVATTDDIAKIRNRRGPYRT
jgi:tetratricopeptide (TPR) repeat protein